MMMRMLEQGGIPILVDNLRTADEDNPNGYYEFEPVKKTKEDASWVAQGVGRVVKLVHLILLDLPLDYRYRVVFMRRNLDEVVKSQDVMLERHGKETVDLPKERLKQIYLSQIDKVLGFLDAHPDTFEYVEVNYNEMLADPGPQIEQLHELLEGLDLEQMRAVVEPKLYRNRAQA